MVTQRKAKKIALPVETWPRVKFLAEYLNADDENDLVLKAVRFLDRAVSAVIDGDELYIRHRDGSSEKLT